MCVQMVYRIFFIISLLFHISSQLTTCRDRSDLFRQDGGLCFEIPPWQHQPVELDGHVARLRRKWGLDEIFTRKQTPSRLTLNNGQDGGLCFEIPPWQHQPVELDGHVARLRRKWGLDEIFTRKQTPSRLTLNNGDISRYMDTVIGPFLDTYHLNIQNSYQQLTSKILRRIKEEVNAAVKTKQQIYKNLTALADELEVPPLCDEERRKARNIATNHVSLTYACTEDARVSIAKMGKYAEQMIALTKKHMQKTVSDTIKTFDLNKVNGSVLKSEIESCLESLSEAAVNLGYELDLSLTNARRHNEQSCEKLTGCVTKARKRSEEGVAEVKDLLYQCVYS